MMAVSVATKTRFLGNEERRAKLFHRFVGGHVEQERDDFSRCVRVRRNRVVREIANQPAVEIVIELAILAEPLDDGFVEEGQHPLCKLRTQEYFGEVIPYTRLAVALELRPLSIHEVANEPLRIRALWHGPRLVKALVKALIGHRGDQFLVAIARKDVADVAMRERISE